MLGSGARTAEPLRASKLRRIGIDAFRPVLVQDEFAEPRMALEGHPEQILDLALVPVDRRPWAIR